MKLLRMRMVKPYICLMGGNGVFCEQVIQSGVVESRSGTGSSKKQKHDIKLIKPDGVVTIFEKPIKASEVMEEYPKHMVCRSDSFYIGQKIPPLSLQDKLRRGNTYFLLPSHIFHSVLSFVTIASFASPQRHPNPLNQLLKSPQLTSTSKREEHEEQMKSRAALLKKAAGSGSRSSPPAFDIQKTKAGTLRIRVSELFISKLIMDQQNDQEDNNNKESLEEDEDEKKKRVLLCTTPQLHKDYKQLVMGSRVRHWKPKLDMISETTPIRKEKRKLLSSASFGIKKRSCQSQSPPPPPPQSSLSNTKSPCKLRRFKLKLRSLTASRTSATASPSCRSPNRNNCKSRKHLQHSLAA